MGNEWKKVTHQLTLDVQGPRMQVKRWELRTQWQDISSWLGDVTLIYRDAEGWGELYLSTDYGRYTNVWRGVGKEGFLRMLLGADIGYLMGKIKHSMYLVDELDIEATTQRIRDMDDSDRWDLDALEDCETPRELLAWGQDNSLYEEDMSGLMVMLEPWGCHALRELILPALQAAIEDYLSDQRKELTMP